MALMNGDRLLRCAALAAALASIVLSPAICAAGKWCPWTVVSLRPPTEDEADFLDVSECPDFPTDTTVVPGFDWLEIFDATDSLHHSYVYVKNLRNGTTEGLLSESATLACRSPDGRYVACYVYYSHVESSALAVVDLAIGKRIDPFPKANAGRVKWSPDSKCLAAVCRRGYEQEASLSAVSFPDGDVKILDATATLGEYDFAWSPDSQWLAVSRPAGSMHYEDYFVSELWIVPRDGGVKCKVIEPDNWEEFALVWLADRQILLQRVFLREGEEEVESQEGTVVIELDLKESPESPPPAGR